MTAPASSVEVASWADFLAAFEWRQGEHLTMVGPTDAGKTTLAVELMREAYPYPWQVAFSTKARGVLREELERDGFRRLPAWSVSDPDVMPRVILAPPLPKGVRSLDTQREAFRVALEAIFRQGGWLVYLDELRYITEYLKLEREVELLVLQGRELGVTVVSGVQRPRHVPLSVYDQARHLFFFRNADGQTLRRLEELTEGMGREVADSIRVAASSLRSHQVVYANPRTGTVLVTEVEV